jgi:hypothetical protein
VVTFSQKAFFEHKSGRHYGLEGSTLEPKGSRVSIPVESLIAKGRFQHSCALEIQPRIEFIGHADTAMYLN